MSNYNYLTYYQEQLNRAIEVLEQNPNRNNYTVEASEALKILARTRPVYKKAIATDELVLVGRLTSKNEIIFDKPRESLLPRTKNFGINSSVYWAGWFTYINVDEINENFEYIKTKKEEYLSYFDIANRYHFQEILYCPSRGDGVDICNSPVLGFMMSDYRNAEVVFYDQYRE